MQTGPTVSVLILKPTLRFVEKHGIPSATLLKAVALAESDLETADARIPFAQFEALTRKAAELTGDADMGLHLAEHMAAGSLGILGFVLMNCRSLGEALEKYCSFQRVAGDGIKTGWEMRDGFLTMRFAFFEGCSTPNRHLMEGMLSSALAMLSVLSGKPILPSEVSFTAASPGNAAEHGRIFRCPVLFNRPHNALIFPESVYEVPVIQPSRDLLALFESHTVDLLQKLDASLVYARKVGEECARMLQGEAPNIDAVARKMSMSPRNLQLKLRQEGTSYRETLDRVRMDMAMGHLKNRQVTVAEVAYLLGFSEPSVFHRTFKRWTGSTPRDFRQGLQSGGSANRSLSATQS